jgi:hypothetical protein
MNMPSPKNTSRTLAEVRAECITLGIQPGRSIAECERRIAEHRGPLSMSEVAEREAEQFMADEVKAIEQDVRAATPPAALLTPYAAYRKTRRNMRMATKRAQRRAKG